MKKSDKIPKSEINIMPPFSYRCLLPDLFSFLQTKIINYYIKFLYWWHSKRSKCE